MANTLESALLSREELRALIVKNGPDVLSEGGVYVASCGIVDAVVEAGVRGEWAYGYFDNDDRRLSIYLSQLGHSAIGGVLLQVSIESQPSVLPHSVQQLRIDGTVRTAQYNADEYDGPYLVGAWQSSDYLALRGIIESVHSYDTNSK